MRSPGWGDYESAAKRGPLAIGWKVLIAIVIIGAALGVIGFVGRGCGEAATVAHEQFGARALLAKYEWFKNASAQLDKKGADVQVYEARFGALKADYSGKARSEWAREDREQWNVWTQEVAGIKASYNGLAAEYNAQMAKFNWRFCNAGSLPAGADTPLPREYREYATN